MILIATLAYVSLEIKGWNISVDQPAFTDSKWEAAKAELVLQLENIVKVVPENKVAMLRKIHIWVHLQSKKTPCMAYHPGRPWLVANDQNPDMEKGVELANLENFISWTKQQPWMVLHELAHGYHDQFLAKGFANPEVAAAYKTAMDSKIYESVRHWNGKMAKHYATTNPMEYFAESTEAYFGKNDFYPVNREDLNKFDPKTLLLMRRIWSK